ncbi:MAG: hypothetical protein JWN51_2407 [Phycisphaerales bacterium]|nr:hypothetical protein [Phycisphaerales bacterium]
MGRCKAYGLGEKPRFGRSGVLTADHEQRNRLRCPNFVGRSGRRPEQSSVAHLIRGAKSSIGGRPELREDEGSLQAARKRVSPPLTRNRGSGSVVRGGPRMFKTTQDRGAAQPNSWENVPVRRSDASNSPSPLSGTKGVESRRFLPHGVLQAADLLDVHGDRVPVLHPDRRVAADAHARRRARHDDRAGP